MQTFRLLLQCNSHEAAICWLCKCHNSRSDISTLLAQKSRYSPGSSISSPERWIALPAFHALQRNRLILSYSSSWKIAATAEKNLNNTSLKKLNFGHIERMVRLGIYSRCTWICPCIRCRFYHIDLRIPSIGKIKRTAILLRASAQPLLESDRWIMQWACPGKYRG